MSIPLPVPRLVFLRKQDETLDDIEQAVSRIGQLGRAIGEELDGQVGANDPCSRDN
jgi:hypothetical protein